MKKFLFMFGFIFCMAVSPLAAEWYEGGTLHDSTSMQFCRAGFGNRVATVADFLNGTTDQGKLRKAVRQLKPAAEDIQQCVVNACEKERDAKNQPAAALILVCMDSLRGEYPWLLSNAETVQKIVENVKGTMQKAENRRDNANQSEQVKSYSGNTKSMKYHNSECRYYRCRTCTKFFNSPQEARQAGYEPCGICGG